ncbi:MAG: NTP transferase domain-containing protein [Caldilineaceae bacterium SB0668_bin_21]|nr:NTP transferase domain-containing protein [Caldilineaceae bacterium SB0668_bin_21]MYC22723.1 NTP transferase domain-containing protein [Caldilineaceae bacterium SB0662_bin_25]
MQEQFDAFITAGYDPDQLDRVSAAAGVAHKSLVPLVGMPMAWHVVRALRESDRIGEIVVVGIGPDEIDFGVPVHHVPNQPSLWASQNAGLRKLRELNADDRYVIALSADIALLSGKIVNRFIEACEPFEHDVYWGIVRKDVMLAAFPESRRTYLPLREGSFCSSDLYLGRLSAGFHIQERIRYFIENRKNVLALVWKLGLPTMFKFLLRRLAIADIVDVAYRIAGVRGGPVVLPLAEAGMDVDKPEQLVQVREYLERNPDHPANSRTQERTAGPGED